MKVVYPLATVIAYGPDDKTVTKLAVGIVAADGRVLATERWVSSSVASDPKIAQQIYAFMRDQGVKTVTTATVILGCPHEEGKDYPHGEDCPFCAFWKGKQGSATSDDRWKAMKTLRSERLGFSYRFWLPG